jgi:hypothetical protein
MFLLFGLRRGGRHARIFVAARIALLLAFLITVFVFHPHGETRDILQVVRFVLLVALIGSGWFFGRKRDSAPTVES